MDLVHSTQTKIRDVALFPKKIISDDRGAVLHMLSVDNSEYREFGEVYFSEIKPQVVKAWKYHRQMTQNIVVPAGLVKFVLFDAREESESRGQIDEITLGRPDHYYLLRIPPKIWYGFQCISAQSALIANCADQAHVVDEILRQPANTREIPYQW